MRVSELVDDSSCLRELLEDVWTLALPLKNGPTETDSVVSDEVAFEKALDAAVTVVLVIEMSRATMNEVGSSGSFNVAACVGNPVPSDQLPGVNPFTPTGE